MNIAELAQQAKQPEPTEKAQIVLVLNYGQSLVLRFSTVKKAEKEYRKLADAWRGLLDGGVASPFRRHFVDADMFTSTVDLHNLCAASLVIHKVASAFIPR